MQYVVRYVITAVDMSYFRDVKLGLAIIDTFFVNFSDKNKRDGYVIASRETGSGNESGRKSVNARCASESGKCNNSNSSNNDVHRSAVTTTPETRGRSGERRSVRPCSTTPPHPDTRAGLPQTGTIKRTSKTHFTFAHCKRHFNSWTLKLTSF